MTDTPTTSPDTPMREFFVVANSNAAPFVSDRTERFVTAETPQKALDDFRLAYSHPAGLFAAAVWDDANAYKKGVPALVMWLSERARREESSKR